MRIAYISEPLSSALQASGMVGRPAREDRWKNPCPRRARRRREDRLLAAGARLAAEDAVLAAMAEARVIGVGAVALRNLAVVLLQPRPHLAHELALQGAGRRQHSVGIGVLRFEQRADVGWQRRGIAQHLAPVVGADPGIVVDPGDAVGVALLQAFWRRSAASARRAALRLSWRRGSHPRGNAYCHEQGGRGRAAAERSITPPSS